MKLSIEEKAKAYDIALKKIKMLLGSGSSCSREELEYVFPQLKQSKDYEIIGRIKTAVEFYWSDEPLDEINAWLEKQGKNNMGISEATKQELKDNLNKALEKETPESWNKFLDEQQPAWSEEDEKMLKWLCRIVHSQRVDKVITLKEESELGEWMDKWLNHNPQPHWKPTDEQMELLREVQQALLGKDCHNRFVNFMYELKRLREE